jgi:hypothetical protein
MPLIKGKAAKTKSGKKYNLEAELEAGKPLKQSLAIMYAQAGESKKKKKKDRKR